MRVALVEATPWDAAGAPVNVYLAGGGSRGYDHRGRTSWKAGVVSEPRFAAGAGYDEKGWTGRAMPQAARFRWMPSDKATLTSVAARLWKNAPVTLLVGDDATAAPVWTVALTGTVTDIQIRDGAIEFSVADLSKKLDEPLLTKRFAGTGGIEGDADIENRIKRRGWGKFWNAEGRILRKAYNVFEFGDPDFGFNAFLVVRDKGRAGVAGVPIAWQGSKAATLAALEASSPPGGGYIAAPSICCVKWWTQPSGPLTADIQGEVGAGYTSIAGTIADRVSAAAGGPAFTAGTVAAINAVRTDEVGIYVEDDSETTASVLDRLLLTYSIFWVLSAAGTITLNPITFTGATETLTADAVERIETYRPTTSRRIGYQRSYRKHSPAEISAAVMADDVEGLGDLALADVVAFGGPYLKQADGTTTATEAAFKTILGTSLGIVNQGTGATANSLTQLNSTEGTKLTGIAANATVGATASTNMYRAGGVTVMTEAEVRTILGTALGLVNQGTGATSNNLTQMNATEGAKLTSVATRAGSTLILYSIGVGTVTIEGNTATLVTNSDWTASVLARQSFKNSAECRARAVGGYYFLVGLTTNLTATAGSFASAISKNTYCMVVNPSLGYATCYANGVAVYDGYPAIPPTSLMFHGPVYRGQRVHFMLGEVELASVAAPAGLVLTPRIDFWYVGASAADIIAGYAGDTNTYRDDGSTRLLQSEIRTIEGTSLALYNQGWYATANAVDFEDNVRVTNKGRVSKLALTGRVTDPTMYNTQALLGMPSTTNLAPTYSASGANWLVTLPAHNRNIAGVSAKVTLAYGSTSGVVAPSVAWWAYYLDPNLTGLASPTVTFTTNPDDLLQAGAYRVAADVAPATGASNPDPPSSGGGAVFRNGQWQLEGDLP